MQRPTTQFRANDSSPFLGVLVDALCCGKDLVVSAPTPDCIESARRFFQALCRVPRNRTIMCGDRDVSRPPASRRLVYGDTETDLSKAGVGIRRLDRRPVPERSQTHVPTDTKVPAHAKHQPNTSFAFTADSSHTEADGAEAEAPVDKEA